MPFALIIFGILFTVAGVRSKQDELLQLLKDDVTGSGNYLNWAFAIILVGAVGYVEKLKPVSDAFIALVIVSMLLHKQGFFTQFQQTLSNGAPSVTSESLTQLGVFKPLDLSSIKLSGS